MQCVAAGSVLYVVSCEACTLGSTGQIGAFVLLGAELCKTEAAKFSTDGRHIRNAAANAAFIRGGAAAVRRIACCCCSEAEERAGARQEGRRAKHDGRRDGSGSQPGATVAKSAAAAVWFPSGREWPPGPWSLDERQGRRACVKEFT